ncbi:hypothetical protein ACJMK2_005008 [Sinanodonta woodiana]|uniref:RNA helicase n=1 Tax=Sinanodonta woodiana TaxID=1069815 RepID=A0ABD3VRC6_SINWO
MPPTAAATKVKEQEYSNWLKVSLALYYLKVGLHSFIQGEVDAMHQFLLQTLYKGTGVSKPKCSSCISKDIKQNRNTYVWRFKSSCPSHLCDIWLAELLTLHTNPTSNKIYWDNCDVTAWPFVPWECVKLYMPRGQLPAGPVKCDSQALLTLMANCKCFHGKLSPAGLRLTHRISKIRNSVMHSEDMRLSDDDSKSYIQDIINLLEDPTHLKSLEECKQAVNEINKIVSDSLDVFFNVELEMIALRTAVDAVRQDMGKQEERTLGSVESLKEEYIQLKEQMRTKINTVVNRVGIVEDRQDTVENRVDIVENRQDTVENRQDTVVNDLETIENRVDCVENRVGCVEDRQDTVENRVDIVENRQDTVVNDLETIENRVDCVENRVGSIENGQDAVENRIVTVENRQDTVENWVVTVENRQDTVENRVVTVENRQDTVENWVVTVENRQDTVVNVLDTIGNRVDCVENRVGSVDSLKEEYVQLKEQMRTKIDTIENRVGIVEDRQDTVENRVGIVQNRQDTVESRVGIVENIQDTIGRDVESAKEHTYTTLQSLEQTNTALQSLENEHKEMQKNLQLALEKTQQQQVELSQALSASVAPLGVRIEVVVETLPSLQESRHRTVENIACKKEPITEGKVKQGYTSTGASWDGCHSDTEEKECVMEVEDNCDEDENLMTTDYDDEANEPPAKKMRRQDPLVQLRNCQTELAKIVVDGENTIICAPTGSEETLVDLHNIKKHPNTTRPRAEVEAADSHQSESENDLASDYESSDEEKPESNQQEHGNPLLNLRNYQLELAEDALRGENTIICAETGSGKTWVALYIVEKHLESASPRKKLVAFMARTNPLIKQQHQRFVKYLPNYTTNLITGDSVHSTALNIFLPDCDIICFTPQILFNNLEKQTVSLSDFSLMILDECHHTKKDEAYNRLMRKYLMAKVKNNVPNLPQILGLTASIGVGKSTSDDEAVNYIISVMANLDTCKLSTVEKYREEIEKYVSRPKGDKIKMKDRSDDLCKKRILGAMIDVQEKLQDACRFEACLVDIMHSKRPRDLTSQQYTLWAKNVERIAASDVGNPETSRLIISCVKYLLVQKGLEKYISNEDQKNPNLETMSKMLQDMILGENTDQESRALVFVKARATCTALANYLEDILGTENIHVHKLTGKSEILGDEGMTEAEQTETLDKFASGEYTVLVSTSVGGEGIDIPDCNIVISYNYAGNEVTKIQMTGRGRKKGGTNIVMGYEKTLDVDKLSTYKAAMMYRAMESIKKIDPRSLQRKIKQFQKEEISKQEFHDRVLETQITAKKKGQFKLCCYKCSVEVVNGEDLRVLNGTYHVVVDKKFKNLTVTKPHKKPNERKIDGLKKADKIYCKKCGMDWGVYFIYNTLPLPTIKCESFKVRNSEDGKISMYKKWLNLPFVIEACELSEITDLLD